MSVKRTKMGMSNKQRFVRSVGLMSAFFMLISCFVLVSLLVMNIIVLNPYEYEKGPRDYWVQFVSEDRMISEYHYIRGQKIDIPADPKHSEDEYFAFTFRGWDITGDNSPDIIPNHAFYDFLAVAVYQKRQIKPLPKSSSEPEDESEEGSSSNPDLSSSSAFIIEGGINYGA